MTGELVLYTHPWSRGRIARWMLEETGQPYRTEIMEYGTTMKAPAYRAINPMGKVPAITHGGVVVTENAAICLYLADAFPKAALAPKLSDPARGPYLRWMLFGAGPFDAASTNKGMGFVTPPDKGANVGYGSLEDVLNVLDAHLGQNDYFAGGTFSAVDVFVGSQIAWTSQFKLIDLRPSFEHYLARILARPAKLRADAIDEALAAKMKEQG